MEVFIENEYLADIYEGRELQCKPKFQQDVIARFIITVNILRAVTRIEGLYQINSLNYDKLLGNKAGYSSVRVTKQYRLEFLEVANKEGQIAKLIITNLSNHYR